MIYKSDPNYKEKELDRILKIRQEKLNQKNFIEEEELRHDGDDGIILESDSGPKNIQTGYYDSNGDLIVGGFNGISSNNPKSKSHLFTVDEIMQFQKNTSKRPSINNPFMNPDITTFNNGDPPVAANSNDDEIKEEMNINFNHDLFRDVDEVFEKKNSQRQFYTIPNTMVPNNQTEFAKWLYLVPSTCKEDTTNCLRYVDLKYQR